MGASPRNSYTVHSTNSSKSPGSPGSHNATRTGCRSRACRTSACPREPTANSVTARHLIPSLCLSWYDHYHFLWVEGTRLGLLQPAD